MTLTFRSPLKLRSANLPCTGREPIFPEINPGALFRYSASGERTPPPSPRVILWTSAYIPDWAPRGHQATLANARLERAPPLPAASASRSARYFPFSPSPRR
ncbi:hypothetical protein ElyMa_002725200 [Elysia marginata]|uniref:Uncharacterized protein n=1 Tax=Elysia marginata TaxID=1093978 RepID=A0AAV4HFC2_9GAST|nr:hypothetical protein ElyMa_002725200 [Elysia marginata]